MEIIEFTSVPAFFSLEKKGLKSNTVRKVNTEDRRFQILKNRNNFLDGLKVRIKNSVVERKYFTRTITDITFWEHIVIISWNPNEKKGVDKRCC